MDNRATRFAEETELLRVPVLWAVESGPGTAGHRGGRGETAGGLGWPSV